MQIAYVRLKPYNPAIGNLKERFRMGASAGWRDFMFVADGTIYELDPTAARWLQENVRQKDHDPSSKLAFDVWYSKAECAKALQLERMVKLGRVRSPLMDHGVSKPPKLQAAQISELDMPPATSAIEAEMNAEQVLAARDLGAETTDDDFGGFVPADDDDLVNAALAEPPAPSNAPPPLAAIPPAARSASAKKPAAKKATAKKATAKKKAAKPPKPKG